MLAPVSRVCTGCGDDKPLNAYRRDHMKPGGYDTRCKECASRAAEPRKARNRAFRLERLAEGFIKQCTKCGASKPVAEFPSDDFIAGGSKHHCRACVKVKHTQWRRENADHVRDAGRKTQRELYAKNTEKLQAMLRRSRLKSKYGLSEATFQLILDSQGGGCAICRTLLDPTKRDRKTHVDHDHKTGAVRGILCLNCNSGIGRLGDDIARLEAAAAYLKKHSGGVS